jgi:hypothetical protein
LEAVLFRACSNHKTEPHVAACVPAKLDGFEARISRQLGNLGFRSDMIDLAWMGCPELRILCRTKTKHEGTFWLQHPAGFGEMIERRFPK